jgi:hypothetical protein
MIVYSREKCEMVYNGVVKQAWGFKTWFEQQAAASICPHLLSVARNDVQNKEGSPEKETVGRNLKTWKDKKEARRLKTRSVMKNDPRKWTIAQGPPRLLQPPMRRQGDFKLSSDQNPHVFNTMTSRKSKPAARKLRASFRGRGLKTRVRGSAAELSEKCFLHPPSDVNSPKRGKSTRI